MGALAEIMDAGAGMWPALVAAGAGIGVGTIVGFVAGRSAARTGLRWPLTTSRGRSARPVAGPAAPDELWNDPSVWSEEAEQAFARARRSARRELRLARLAGRNARLVPFHDVMADKRTLSPQERGECSVPISSIVGSVDKPFAFTTSFEPASDALRTRWKKAYGVAHGLAGYQPVELYQVGDRFFVVDGHFRISVTKALGGESIRARVKEWA